MKKRPRTLAEFLDCSQKLPKSKFGTPKSQTHEKWSNLETLLYTGIGLENRRHIRAGLCTNL